MAKNGSVDFRDLEKFRDKLQKHFSQSQVEAFIESCAKELAARLLAKVVKRTPVGDYSGDSYTCTSGKVHKGTKVPGKVGGTLRRGWTNGKQTNATAYANGLKVSHVGNAYTIEIINPVEYAPYVEYGHRKRGGNGWVEGHFMLTISEQEIQANSRAILEKKLQKKLGECFN